MPVALLEEVKQHWYYSCRPVAKIFRRKDITLTRNRVIRICIQNTLVPPIAGYF